MPRYNLPQLYSFSRDIPASNITLTSTSHAHNDDAQTLEPRDFHNSDGQEAVRIEVNEREQAGTGYRRSS